MKYLFFFFIIFLSISYSQIKFDADFESGNIASVSTSDSVSFEVTTAPDIGSRWFYFRISGVKNKFIKVSIPTSDVNRAMYSYDDKNYVRFTKEESPKRNYFEKAFTEDTVYVAYYTPYTFSYLQSRIADWKKSSFVTVDTLGFTEHNFPMQEIIVTDKSVPDENKLRVWIHARTHPGETPGSWHFDGIVQELLKEYDEVIDYYRKKIIFYLYPFDNPEGVYYGRSRTNFYGVDQERDWNKSDDETSSAVLMLKNRMKEINSEKVLSIALNLHSQASSSPTFWIHNASSTSESFYTKEYQFANLASSDLPYFVHSDYRESSLKNYFPEGFMWANYGEDILALTYETPYDHYTNGVWVTNQNLFEFGSSTLYGIAEFLNLSTEKHLIIDNDSAFVEGDWTSSQFERDYFGDDFYYVASGFGDKSITYQSPKLGSGSYAVFAWWSVSSANATNAKYEISLNGKNWVSEVSQQTDGGKWNLISTIELADSGNVDIKLTNNADGVVVADAIRIIYNGPISTVKENTVVKTFELYQNYPNPFNPTTTIKFKINKSENVKLRIFNSLGELVDTIVDEYLAEGTHQVVFNAGRYNSITSGVYYYQLITDSYSETKGMLLLK